MRLVPALRLAAVCVLAGVAPAAAAATFTVTKTADTADGACDADCSLREAIQAANATPGPDVVRLRHRWYGLARPTVDGFDDDNAVAGDLDVTDDLVLRGLPERSDIDAQGLDRVLEVLPGVSAELIDVTLKEGRVMGRGGCVYNEGTLVLRRAWLTRCSVFLGETGVLDGGGLFNLGEVRLIFAKVYRNRAVDGTTGGRGAGIFNGGGATLFMYDSDVRDNVAGLDDAAGNGAGLFNWGAARIDRSFFYRNDPGDGEGSAMANRENASLSVHNTTISGNGHDGALGAIANGTRVPLGSEIPGKLYLFNVTVADNNGGGLFTTGRVTLHNTLVAGNFTQDGSDRSYHSGHNCLNEGGDITQAYSLIGDDGNCFGAIMVDNATVFDVVLQHLAYVGGPTPIHPQRPGPYTIDTGDPGQCPPWDQRQGRRPADGDMNDTEICDIGAAEHGADE